MDKSAQTSRLSRLESPTSRFAVLPYSALEETLATLIGADPTKPGNVRTWLHSILSGEELAAWPRTAKANKLSLAAADIADSSIPHKDTLARYYKLKKLGESFGENYTVHVNPVTGKIHPTYAIGGAESGRFTCSKPNLQQIPGRPSRLEGVPGGETYRKLITAAPGRLLVVGDLSQIEIRVAAQISQCVCNGSQALPAIFFWESWRAITPLARLRIDRP